MATHMTKSIHSPLMKFRYSNTHSVSNMPVDLELYLEFFEQGGGGSTDLAKQNSSNFSYF